VKYILVKVSITEVEWKIWVVKGHYGGSRGRCDMQNAGIPEYVPVKDWEDPRKMMYVMTWVEVSL
jgi:hypothetical protein